MTDFPLILSQNEQDDPNAADQLLLLMYDELRRLATAMSGPGNPGQTLQPTALMLSVIWTNPF
jgi:hypothetical protein